MQLTLMNLSSQDTSLHTTLAATYVYALNFSRKLEGTNVTVWGETLFFFFFNFFNVESKI